MTDYRTPIEALAKEIHQTAVDHGFWDNPRNTGEMLMLVVSELAEALEEDRAGTAPYYIVAGKPEGFAIEMVDALIRILDTLGALELDQSIDELIRIKMTYNNTRPHMHGKAY